MYFSMRKTLLAMLILSMTTLSAWALTPTELSDWAKTNNLVSATENTSSDVTRGTATPLYVNITKYYWGKEAIEKSIASSTQACTFSDVNAVTPNISAIADACKLGVIRGKSDGSFAPAENLSPAQALTILMRVIGGRQAETGVTPWYKSYADLASKHGITSGLDDALIRDGKTITQAKILEWVYNAKNSTTLRSDPALSSASANMFGSAEFLGEKKMTTSGTVPTVNPMIKDMNMGAGFCSSGTWYCKWFGFGGACGWLCWIWWLIVLGLLWKLWCWLMCDDSTDDKKVSPRAHGEMNMHNVKKSNTSATLGVTAAWAHAGTKKSGATSGKKEDLQIIEGIGPKVESLLYENGITTFAQIADMTPASLSAVIAKYGSNYAAMRTDTWPAQSALARDGKMAELEAWKVELDNGRERA
jgi:predicted flap endonuclease-1-like 5' DNA nuclease